MALLFLIDISIEMSNKDLNKLTEKLRSFSNELSADTLAKRRVEFALVEFDSSVRVSQDFFRLNTSSPPSLLTSRNAATAMGAAIEKSIEIPKSRKEKL